jgi:hypothetical protein
MFIKPGPNFKLSKPSKTLMALGGFKDAHERGAFKRAMIQAELAAAIRPVSKKDRDGFRK